MCHCCNLTSTSLQKRATPRPSITGVSSSLMVCCMFYLHNVLVLYSSRAQAGYAVAPIEHVVRFRKLRICLPSTYYRQLILDFWVLLETMIVRSALHNLPLLLLCYSALQMGQGTYIATPTFLDSSECTVLDRDFSPCPIQCCPQDGRELLHHVRGVSSHGRLISK